MQAMGPGRGYCAQGGFLTVRYVPIGACNLLAAARKKAASGQKVVALITDIGNDIMYEVAAEEIISCLDRMIQELTAMGAEVFLNPIPLAIEEDVSEFQFRLLKTIFYPRSKIKYSQAADAVRRINRFLQKRAGGRVHLLPSVKNFCGADKIHYSLFKSHHAWTGMIDEMLRVLPGRSSGAVGLFSMWKALFANMGRLCFCDMIPVRDKIPGTF